MPDEIPAEVRTTRRDIARLVTQRNSFLREAARTGAVDHARLRAIDDSIGGLLDGVLPLIDACDASEAEPLVLLPVRVETRFSSDGAQSTLRVRIYPDEMHIDDLVRGLTPDEATAGQSYWTAVWADPVPENAWADFAALVGTERAEWVAHVCTPANLAERGSAATPTFSQAQPRGPRNVVARALPDRFVVLALQDGEVSRAVGRPIPPDLASS